jgi:protein gp37
VRQTRPGAEIFLGVSIDAVESVAAVAVARGARLSVQLEREESLVGGRVRVEIFAKETNHSIDWRHIEGEEGVAVRDGVQHSQHLRLIEIGCRRESEL